MLIDKAAECTRHLNTFCKERSNSLPERWVIVEYDAFLVHADELQPQFAAKPGYVVTVLHYMEHTWGPAAKANLGVDF